MGKDGWIRSGDIILLCFSVNDRRSWKEIAMVRERVLRIKEWDEDNHAMILVGTKCDLRTVENEQMMCQQDEDSGSHNEFVDPRMVIAKAREWKVPYIETS